MKIRIMGTLPELEAAKNHFLGLRGNRNVELVEVSTPYANRAPSTLYRLYVEVVYSKRGKYQQRQSPAEPWGDVSDYGIESALTCNGELWDGIAARLKAGEVIKTEFAEYRLLKGGGA